MDITNVIFLKFYIAKGTHEYPNTRPHIHNVLLITIPSGTDKLSRRSFFVHVLLE